MQTLNFVSRSVPDVGLYVRLWIEDGVNQDVIRPGRK